ncbi:TRAP transporter small permease subunit [Desulfatirhabdium butyrativorans]|uniref:TRAP transporter small permease subunit n=1 Tax=Desulfatirhabdium butyrativorans TaxID=340467 RepID=UPI00040300FD|nr:TRAP transporter small permease subunit [Desulfatirhabdium butyrativorans]
MKRFWQAIDKLNRWIGRACAWLILPLTLIILYEVVSRYIFNAPTRWSNEISQYVLVAIVMLGGAYCLADNEHVSVDIFYRNFTQKTRDIVDMLTCLVVLCFVCAMVWKGADASYDALVQMKRSQTILELPLFPSMVMVPIGATLLGLQSLVRAIQAFERLRSKSRPAGKGA